MSFKLNDNTRKIITLYFGNLRFAAEVIKSDDHGLTRKSDCTP